MKTCHCYYWTLTFHQCAALKGRPVLTPNDPQQIEASPEDIQKVLEIANRLYRPAEIEEAAA